MKTTTRARAQISTVNHGMKRPQLTTRPSAGGPQGTHRERTAFGVTRGPADIFFGVRTGRIRYKFGLLVHSLAGPNKSGARKPSMI